MPSPTARQAEYLAFIRAFTDRWRIPPSFEEIGRHFTTTAPSVNNMIKTLEARGFLVRIPGQARTLRVVLPEAPKAPREPSLGKSTTSNDGAIEAAVQMASLVAERLVYALKGEGDAILGGALDAVRDALDVACAAAGASEDRRREAQATLLQVASIAQGSSPETRPGRKLPWWKQPR